VATFVNDFNGNKIIMIILALSLKIPKTAADHAETNRYGSPSPGNPRAHRAYAHKPCQKPESLAYSFALTVWAHSFVFAQ